MKNEEFKESVKDHILEYLPDHTLIQRFPYKRL